MTGEEGRRRRVAPSPDHPEAHGQPARPSRRHQDPPPAVVEALGELELLDLHGRPVRLGTLWEVRPAALVFLRHYG